MRQAQVALFAGLREATADVAQLAVPVMARLACLLSCAGQEGIAAVARDLGVTEEAVRRWLANWSRPPAPAAARLVEY